MERFDAVGRKQLGAVGGCSGKSTFTAHEPTNEVWDDLTRSTMTRLGRNKPNGSGGVNGGFQVPFAPELPVYFRPFSADLSSTTEGRLDAKPQLNPDWSRRAHCRCTAFPTPPRMAS